MSDPARARMQTADEQGETGRRLRPQDLLAVQELHTYFTMDEGGVVKAVNGVSFEIEKEKVLGVVGESGCGKSVTALSIMQLLPKPHGHIHGGRILFRHPKQGVLDLAKQDPGASLMRQIRGNEIAMIFQEPMTSLNPRLYRGGASNRGSCHAAPEGHGKTGMENGGRNAGQRGHSQPGTTGERIPLPNERRHAAARHDRHGPFLQPDFVDCG